MSPAPTHKVNACSGNVHMDLSVLFVGSRRPQQRYGRDGEPNAE